MIEEQTKLKQYKYTKLTEISNIEMTNSEIFTFFEGYSILAFPASTGREKGNLYNVVS